MKTRDMPTPNELATVLDNGAFTVDQAYYIAAEVYQPLLECIKSLEELVGNKKPLESDD